MKIMCVVGTRPEIIKLAGLLTGCGNAELIIVHTGQHYDYNMSGALWQELELPLSKFFCGVRSGSHVYQISEGMKELTPIIERYKPDAVLVIGDANPTLTGALTAHKMGIDVIHVEAGLRSFDRSMPEEINRKLIDVVSDLLFVTEPAGMTNLENEGLADNAYLVGNVAVDLLRKHEATIIESPKTSPYILCTLHRPSNVDDPAKCERIRDALLQINREYPIIFPKHPRTHLPNFQSLPPLGYRDFMRRLKYAKMVITDSGGVQEEALAVQTPCLTLRDNTERPITLVNGANVLVTVDGLYDAYRSTLDREIKFEMPTLWDGRASHRIGEIIQNHYGDQTHEN